MTRGADTRAGDVPAPLDGEVDRFVERLRARLVAGAATYGVASLQRPCQELIDEIQEELEDVAGWGLVLWVRLERLRDQVANLDQGGADERF